MNDESTPSSQTSDEAAESEEVGVRGETGGLDEARGPGEAGEAEGADVREEADEGEGPDEANGEDSSEGEGQDSSESEGEDSSEGEGEDSSEGDDDEAETPPEVRKYERFKKVDGAQYERVNDFLRERTYITAREWAIARLCADFRTETGVEMTKIGENLPELVPFMEDTYTPQAVNQARSSFDDKVTKAGATFLYGAMCDFYTAEQLDELMYEVTEVAKFLLEVEGVDLAVEDELEAEDRISSVMREVREASEALRYEECPHCGENLRD